MSRVLDGKSLAKALHEQIANDVEKLLAQQVTPNLTVVMATDDESTLLYVKHIEKLAISLGMTVTIMALDRTASTEDIAAALQQAAGNPKVHGIILQTPLAGKVDIDYLRTLIPEPKDVDGASPLSLGKLMSGYEAFAPSTAAAVLHMLLQNDVNLEGKQVVIVGRSLIVGKPVAMLLLAKDATVTICHSKTANLSDVTKRADILVVAVGKPHFIDAGFVKPGAVVIDVGTNVTEDNQLVGDVDESVQTVAGAISLVPGGVGPVTTAILLKQTVEAAKKTL